MRDPEQTDPDDILSLQKFRQDLKEAEAVASRTLKEVGSLLQTCANHFATVRRQNRQRESLDADLPHSVANIQLNSCRI